MTKQEMTNELRVYEMNEVNNFKMNFNGKQYTTTKNIKEVNHTLKVEFKVKNGYHWGEYISLQTITGLYTKYIKGAK